MKLFFNRYMLFFFLLSISTISLQCMGKFTPLIGGKYTIIDGPDKGKIITIEGDCKKIFNVKDLDEVLSRGNSPMAVAIYYAHIMALMEKNLQETLKNTSNYPKNIQGSATILGGLMFLKKYQEPFYYGKVDELRIFDKLHYSKGAVTSYESKEEEKMPRGVCVHASWLEEIVLEKQKK